MSKRDNLSAGGVQLSYEAIAGVAHIDADKLFSLCSHLNKRMSLPEGHTDGKSCNLLSQVRLGVNGYTLDKLAPLVDIAVR